MDGTLGEIRIFASNFAPRNWAFCEGQIMAISQNTALFSILGTNYGGNGRVTFGLPDFRGRTAVGVGQGNGLTPYDLGQTAGTEGVSLLSTEMPLHTHSAIAQPGSGSSASAILNGVNGAGGASTPGGNYIGQDSDVGSTSYSNSGTPIPMHDGSVQITNVTAPIPTVMTGITGAGNTHDNMQPTLVLHYIICTDGEFPRRS